MLTDIIKKLSRRENLSQKEAAQLLQLALQPETDPLQTVAALVLLHAKGETAEEIAALRQILLQQAYPAMTGQTKLLDIVGTGGDGANTVNISTGSAILAASMGIKVAKHGNRAVSSQSGSADVLAELGIPLEISADKIAECLDECHIGFYFAPNFHPALSYLRELRQRLAVPTVLNLLGPLLNPACPTHYLCGVAKPELVPLFADVFATAGIEKALVFNGHGLDELSTLGPVEAILVSGQETATLTINPADYGLSTAKLDELRGGDAFYNAILLRHAFAGEPGAIADTLALNAGVASYLYGLHSSIADGVKHAQENLRSGAAQQTLEHWITIANHNDFLATTYKRKQREVHILKEKLADHTHLLQQTFAPQKDVIAALKNNQLAIIAEVKRHSPAVGYLADIPDPITLAQEYVAVGANMISVLTDAAFQADINDLTRITDAGLPVPVLRKDFIIDPIQILESKLAGADIILLIVAMVGENLPYLLSVTRQMGLYALVEVHDRAEMEFAVNCGADIIGVNNRDLRTLVVDTKNALDVIRFMPDHIVRVAESGIENPILAQNYQVVGYDAVLIGSALVQSWDKAGFINACRNQI